PPLCCIICYFYLLFLSIIFETFTPLTVIMMNPQVVSVLGGPGAGKGTHRAKIWRHVNI
uniref:Nucleoside-diphosphate kinase n=1 Tax=Oncorhynchus mykiss TaxID=8022 RepID=A0A8C7VAQ6_ONCMY